MDGLVSVDCRDCSHFRKTSIFELCEHAESTYRVAEKVDQHTATHMRRTSQCGPEGKLFTPRKES